MAQVRSENVIEIAVDMLHEDTPITNVWHMFADEAADLEDVDTVQDFANNWQDIIMPQFTANITLERFRWVSLDPDDANAGVILPDPGKPRVGQVSGASFPASLTGLVHKRTPNRPRGRRDGRAYFPGVRETDVDTFGNWTAAALTTWNNALSNFFAAVDEDDVDTLDGVEGRRWFVVLETTEASRTPGQQEVIVGSRRVTSLVMDPKVGHQRNRLR